MCETPALLHGTLGYWGKSNEREDGIRESWVRAGGENHEEPEEPGLSLTLEEDKSYRSRIRGVKSSWGVSEH